MKHIHAELAKPEPEPVAYRYKKYSASGKAWKWVYVDEYEGLAVSREALFTAPPAAKEWVGLTDEEIQPINITYGFQDRFTGYARAIESALRAKNTGEQA